MKNSTKRNLKITFNGETKRVKAVSDYKTLVQKTQQAFALEPSTSFKFYYLDEEQEIISISSQFDLDEALEIESEGPTGCLKLIIAVDASQARSILEQQFQENASMRDLNASLNQSQFMILNSERSLFQEEKPQAKQFVSTGTSFEKLSRADMIDSSNGTEDKMMHNIGVGPTVKTTEQSTDVFNLIGKKNMGCDAQKVMMHDQEMCTNAINMMDSCTQARMEVRDSSCGDRVETNNQGSQMQVENCDQEASCLILVPSDEDEEMDDPNAEQIPCFKCKGSQMNKKGLPCRKCNGTGTVSSHMFGDLLEVVRNQIREMCTISFREQIKVYLAEKQLKQAEVIHEKIICDGCDVDPIKGIRYMCSVRHDYDLCEKCEAKKNYPYPMLKIRFPEQAPVKLVCQYQHSSQQNKNNPLQKAQAKSQNKNAPKKYLGRFIKENFGDKYTVAPNQTFTKEWTFRNDGKDEWPEDTILIQTNGDEIGAASQPIDKVVKPNEEYTWILNLKAPAQPGRYTSYFRMTTENNYRFGHKVWCDINVADINANEQISMPLNKQPQVEKVNVKELAAKRPLLTDQQPNKGKAAEKEVSSFEKKLTKEEIERNNAIDQIKDLGLSTDEKIIGALFDKYKKVEIVAAVLAESRLSESDFQVVTKATH